MIKFRHHRHNLTLLALATVCTAGTGWAQENVSGPNSPPVIIDRKQATRLVVAQPAPEYPAVAKVNYIQGPVQLELTVNGAGKVANAHVLTGNAILAASSLKAVLRWIYHPLTTASGPSGFITTVELKFALNSRGLDLTPQQAERDFLRQVKPPQVVRAPEDAGRGDVVHMRLLVNDQGQVVDMDVTLTGRAEFEAARETLQGWTFRPARWGALPIASYLELDVPVSPPSIARGATSSGGR